MLEQYKKFKLKTGELATMLEKLDEDTLLAEVVHKDGEIDTTEVKMSEIYSVIREVEEPFTAVSGL